MAIPSLKGKAIPSFNPVAKFKIAEKVESEKQTFKTEIRGSYKVLMSDRTAQKAFEKLHKAWALAKPEKSITGGVSLSIRHCFTGEYDIRALHALGSQIREGFAGDFLIEKINCSAEKSKTESVEFVFDLYFHPEEFQFRRGDFF